jgi:hypothetical protein
MIDKLLATNPYSFSIEYNEHKNYYETVEQCYDDKKDDFVDWDECVRTNTVYELHVYPRTPIGFYVVYASTLEKAIEKALED